MTMLDSDRIPDLRRLYTLFLRVPMSVGKDALRFAIRSDAEERGKLINEGANEVAEAGPSGGGGNADAGMDVEVDQNDPKGKGKVKQATGTAATALTSALRWVQDVLDLKDKFDGILDQAFGGDKAIQMSINEVSGTK